MHFAPYDDVLHSLKKKTSGQFEIEKYFQIENFFWTWKIFYWLLTKHKTKLWTKWFTVCWGRNDFVMGVKHPQPLRHPIYTNSSIHCWGIYTSKWNLSKETCWKIPVHRTDLQYEHQYSKATVPRKTYNHVVMCKGINEYSCKIRS